MYEIDNNNELKFKLKEERQLLKRLQEKRRRIKYEIEKYENGDYL